MRNTSLMMNTYETEDTASEAPGFDVWVDVELHVDTQLGLIQFCLEGERVLGWSDNIAAIAAATADSAGTAQWCEKYSKLLVPSSRKGAGNRFFTVTRMDPEHGDGDRPAA
jgi:hypothetical protein